MSLVRDVTTYIVTTQQFATFKCLKIDSQNSQKALGALFVQTSVRDATEFQVAFDDFALQKLQ